MPASLKYSSELINSMEVLQISAYIDTACFAILFYDYLLTLEDERTLIWQSNWSLPKVVFLVTRYLPYIDLSITAMRHFKAMTPDACQRNYKAGGLVIDMGICLAELIPILRTWAIWGQSRTITIVLFIWSAINFGTDLVLVALYFNSVRFTSLPVGLSGCLVSNGNSLLVGAWVILMVFEAGAIFYVYIFALSVANVIVIASFPRDFAALLASVERVAHAVLMERLVITLRKAARHELEEEDLTRLDTMRFEQDQRRPIETEAGTSTFVSSFVGDWTCPGPSTSTASRNEPAKDERSGGCDA
ncbi:uncharacterized protein FOMMEDRAFT_161583 [Fomitiporia mediterranea MF3/22]|uniref:uncharacterized protein n=1 Tax=Fomitiporia mediterranea (strain MF3/22) TaxID=694068 RepID=UPI00044079E3|nr:uncharacterized protein FOMMEDRAFT_161583 [Fomitiporia mediterranea MF3/22]EJC98750.1 hypothetical protein FOMMEDRAFT_161583 [Fomitiporia mediterranea MF3/22]